MYVSTIGRRYWAVKDSEIWRIFSAWLPTFLVVSEQPDFLPLPSLHPVPSDYV